MKAQQFNGTHLLPMMDFDMGGAFVKTRNGNQFLWPGEWIVPDGDFFAVLKENPCNQLKQKNMPTLGESRVRTTFNPANDSAVDQIKQKSAELIDLIDSLKPTDGSMMSGEKARLIAKAQTDIEQGAMWGVKAATFNL